VRNQTDEEERRGRLKEDLKDAILEQAAAPAPAGKPPGKPRRRQKKTNPPQTIIANGSAQIAIGNHNTQISGDAIITDRIVHKIVAEVKPGSEHIDDAQASELLTRIRELADLHNLVKRSSVTPQHYWSRLNRYCKVPKYRLIKAADYPKALAWCLKQRAILGGTKTAQKKDPHWRNKKIAYIKINVNKLNIEAKYREYLALTFHRLSTAGLDDGQLLQAYRWVASQKRKKTPN
jgi:hypothetical protein